MVTMKFTQFTFIYLIVLFYSVFCDDQTNSNSELSSSKSDRFTYSEVMMTTPADITSSKILLNNTYQSSSERTDPISSSSLVAINNSTQFPEFTTTSGVTTEKFKEIFTNTYPSIQTTMIYSNPGSVSNLTLNSSYPHYPLNISWEPPKNPNGEIVQYLIWVQNPNNNNQCVLKMSINCIDCANNISVPFWPDIFNCSMIVGSTFTSNDKTFSITINDRKILPYTPYLINVRGLNGIGWGNISSKDFKTSQYTSESVTNLSVSSSFPSSPLLITWSPPDVPNGEIVQYFIWVQNPNNNNQCVLTMSINCTGCTNNISAVTWPDNSTNDCTAINGSTFKVNDTKLSITINNERILPCTKYRIQVTPLNGYGWGNHTFNFTNTSTYVSGPVFNLSVSVSFPIKPLTITWQLPQNTTVEIIQYFIWIQNAKTNECVLTTQMNCTNCSNNQLMPTWNENNITGCHSIAGTTFNSNSVLFSIMINDLVIQPNSSYKINVRPYSKCGWGQISSYLVVTPAYNPDPVANLSLSVDQSRIIICWTAPVVHSLNYHYNILTSNSTFISYKTVLSNYSCFHSDPLEFCSNYQFCVTVIDDYNVSSSIKCKSQQTGLSNVTIYDITPSVTGNNIYLIWTYGMQSNCLVMFNIVSSKPENLTISTSNYLMKNLKYVTKYLIIIIPLTYMNGTNIYFQGTIQTLNVTTNEGVPTIVSNFKCTNQSYTEIECKWTLPNPTNGEIKNYWITCRNESIIYDRNTTSTEVVISDGVVTDKLFTCQVKASTSVGYGNSTFYILEIKPSVIPYVNNTDIIPRIMGQSELKVTDEQKQIAITLPYAYFSNKNGTIQMFTLVVSRNKLDIVRNKSIPSLKYENDAYGACINKDSCTYEIQLPDPNIRSRTKRSISSQYEWENRGFIIGNSTLSNDMSNHISNGPLNSGTLYVIGFRAYTTAGFITVGFVEKETGPNTIPIIIGVAVGVFVVICISIVVYFSIRYKRNRPLPESAKFLPIDNKSPAVHEFHANFEYMKQDSNGRMIDDFKEIKDQAIKLERQKILVFADGNDMKNRYSNIKPYKHNRVKLLANDDYINASRICILHWHIENKNVCNCSNIYIATQGPIGENREPKLPTMGDFWKMVLENNVCVIVNLTRVEEHGKEKCSQYWPTELNQKSTYYSENNPVEVEMVSVKDYSIFAEREFRISMEGKQITVTQFHMLAWNDHSCPTTSEFMKFYLAYQKVRQSNQPVVVHCSAGVGRTGTFILIDEELSRISKEKDKIEIYNNLLNLRKCRCQMVQTESQYCFIYSVIHEYLVQSGLIKIPRDKNNTNLHRQSYENPIFVE